MSSISKTGGSVNARDFTSPIVAAPSAALDFDTGAVQTISISDDTEFSLTGMSATLARSCRVKVTAGASSCALTFPSDWQWIGDKPTSLLANTTAYFYLSSEGENASDVVASWVVVGDGA